MVEYIDGDVRDLSGFSKRDAATTWTKAKQTSPESVRPQTCEASMLSSTNEMTVNAKGMPAGWCGGSAARFGWAADEWKAEVVALERRLISR